LAQIILIHQYTKLLENLLQPCNIVTDVTWRSWDDVIFDVIKNAVYIQRRTLKKSFSKEKHDTVSQLLKE